MAARAPSVVTAILDPRVNPVGPYANRATIDGDPIAGALFGLESSQGIIEEHVPLGERERRDRVGRARVLGGI